MATQTKSRSRSKASKRPVSRKRGSQKVKSYDTSGSDTVKSIADSCHVGYRRARRVARSLGLGVGRGNTYNSLTKAQVNKLTKALS